MKTKKQMIFLCFLFLKWMIVSGQDSTSFFQVNGVFHTTEGDRLNRLININETAPRFADLSVALLIQKDSLSYKDYRLRGWIRNKSTELDLFKERFIAVSHGRGKRLLKKTFKKIHPFWGWRAGLIYYKSDETPLFSTRYPRKRSFFGGKLDLDARVLIPISNRLQFNANFVLLTATFGIASRTFESPFLNENQQESQIFDLTLIYEGIFELGLGFKIN